MHTQDIAVNGSTLGARLRYDAGILIPFGGDAGLPIMRFFFLKKQRNSNRLSPRVRCNANGEPRRFRKFSLGQPTRIFAWGLVACSLLRPAEGSDLSALAALNAVSGNEQEALDYVRTRVGGHQKVDNTGSLTATFGRGQPHTLLVAGLDEPGYLVSRIDQEGYLRVHRLADPAPHYDFDEFFVGQPVLVRTRAGKTLPGVVAARSAHFESRRPYPSQVDPRELFIDLGASSKQDVGAAGIDLLDPVTLEKRLFSLGNSGSVHRALGLVACRRGDPVAARRRHAPESSGKRRDFGVRVATIFPQPRVGQGTEASTGGPGCCHSARRGHRSPGFSGGRMVFRRRRLAR